MSEWIDFVVYATQILLFLVFLPRHSAAFHAADDRRPQPGLACLSSRVCARLERQPLVLERVLRLGRRQRRGVALGLRSTSSLPPCWHGRDAEDGKS